MHTPYTYILRHKPTGQVYYGVRWKLGCVPNEFWKSYFTSSSKLIPLYRTIWGDECWEWEIRRTFDSGKKARDWEEKVLRRMKVIEKSDIWLNRTNNKAILNAVSPRGMLGKKHSKEANKKRSISMMGKNKGRIHTDKSKENFRQAKLGKKNPWYGKERPDHSKRMSGKNHPLFGKPVSKETREKMRKSRLAYVEKNCG